MADAEPTTVDRLIEEVVDARARGEAVDEAALIARHPLHGDELRARLASLGRIDALLGGARREAAEPALPPDFAGYKVLERLGDGGMSSVFLAEQKSLGRRVALKVMPAAWARDGRAAARFRREAETLARLSHPLIAPIHEFGSEGGSLYIAFDHIPGADLGRVVAGLGGRLPRDGGAVRTLVERHGKTAAEPGPWDEPYARFCARLVADVARTLEHAHGKGFVHRDIKPSNIIVGTDGRPRLIDFGLSLGATTDALTGSRDFLGTVYYASPEQVSGWAHELGPQSDVFSLGAVLYELLALKRAFAGENVPEVIAAVVGREVDVGPLADMPSGLRDVCLKALEKDRARRYPTARAFAEDLERVLAGQPVEAPKPRLAGWAFALTRRRPSLVAALAVVVASAGGVRLTSSRWADRFHQADRAAKAERARSGAELGASARALRIEAYLRRVAEGRALIGQGRDGEAGALLSEAITAEPTRGEAYLARAESWKGLGDVGMPLGDLAAAERALGRTREVLFGRAQVLSRAGRDVESLEAERELVLRFPGDVEAALRLASRLLGDGTVAEAARVLEPHAKRSPGDARVLAAGAWLELARKDVPRALARAKAAVEAAPDSTEASAVLGRALFESGRFREAAQTLRRVVRANPSDGRSRRVLAEALTSAGELKEGERQFLACVEQAPEDEAAWQGLGANLVRQGRRSEAVNAFKRALRPGSGGAINAVLAELLESLGRGDEAAYFKSAAGAKN